MADDSEELQGTPPQGHPLSADAETATAQPGLPGFIARPKGTPVYHGFPVFADAEVDGFRFGTITDFEAEDGATDGDAFVVAPDGSRAGLVWERSSEAFVEENLPPTPDRWGVWNVGFPYPMQTRADAKRNLEAIVPLLKEHWDRWRTQT